MNPWQITIGFARLPHKSAFGWCCAGFLLASLSFPRCSHAEVSRAQTLELRAGWNSVWLEVEPLDYDPGKLLAGSPVDVVASYFAPQGSLQFIVDPGVDLFQKTGWGVWYSDKRPDAFLKTLHTLQSGQAYIIHSKQDYTLTIQGAALPYHVRWQPNAFNLVGFPVAPQAGPTFAQYFSGSFAHRNASIYRLTEGSWRRVLSPASETMRSGEAFWIYCDGPSKFQGPLTVETTFSQGLFLGTGRDALILRNLADYPVTPTVQHVASGTNTVPMSIVIRSIGTNGSIGTVSAPKPAGPWSQALPPLEPGESISVPLEMRLEDARAVVQDSLLKVSADAGVEIWVPVVGVRKDLEDQ